MTRIERPWTAAEKARVRELKRAGMGPSAVAAAMWRSIGSVSGVNYQRGRGAQPNSGGQVIKAAAPDRVLAEWDVRRNLAPRDLTAALCGDPLPGFSALDRRDLPQPAPTPRRATTLFLDQLAMRRAGG